jgi:3-oxoacyl-[acyl-carrier protein] reductase
MAAEGSRVVVNDIDLAEAVKVVAEIQASGGTAIASGEDVGDWLSARSLVEQCVEAFGGVDALVNNAGLARTVPIWEEEGESFDKLMRVNLKGTFNVTRHSLDHMIPHRRGAIVNISSGSQAGHPGVSVYGATKAGVASFTYSWALELAPYNIRVNAIAPAAQTRMSAIQLAETEEIPPFRRPENTAPLVVYLLSDEANWITGQVFRQTGNLIGLFTHPKPIHLTAAASGWTLGVLRERLRRRFGGRLEPVGLNATDYQFAAGPARLGDPGAS